jgi:hypothetical protein
VSTARLAIAASFIAAVTSGCGMSVQVGGSQIQGTTTPTDAQRRDCERNNGSWSPAAGICRIGS